MIFLKLRNIIAKTEGILLKICIALLIIFPHSLTTERVVSHYN